MTKDFERRIQIIEDRNARVEADKAWETSWLRRILISSITFIFIGLYLIWLGVNKPWLNAVVPVAGFLLSTMAIQKVKEIWLHRRNG